MSHLSYMEKLLNGVEVCWEPLDKVFNIYAGGDVPTDALSDIETEEFNIPILSNGIGDKSLYGWTNQAKIEKPSLTISARGTIGWTSYRDRPFFPIVRLLVLTPKFELNLKYAYHFMKMIENNYKVAPAGIPQLTKPMLKNVFIPIPCPDNPEKSLAIQAEIARILDVFTAMTAKLTAELNMRKKQYNYYRYQLLNFEESEVEWKTLGEICESITSGKNKDKSETGKFPVYGSTGVIGRTNIKAYEIEQILVARVGANAGRVNIASGKYDVSDNTLILKLKNKYNLKFLYYYLVNLNLNRFVKGGGQPLLTAGQLKSMVIPVPMLEEQSRIVSILDNFDIITNSISEGLPREIELRQKQYEYYRDMLLSFPKSDEVA
ncbi:restriction endonuclease subunit S [Proteus mirabilis]|nr:restriction endonuclease subunit S [Proteus mirabilis]